MNLHDKPVNEAATAISETRRSTSDVDPPSAVAIFVAASVLLLGAYTSVFAVTLGTDVGSSFGIALSNVAPLALLSAATYRLLRDLILPRGVLLQASAHLLLGPAFAGLWYVATLTCQGLVTAATTGAFSLGRFSGLALVWQLFQGVVLYALVASITYALRGGRLAAPVQLASAAAPLERYLTRQGDELVPVEVKEIALIRGAQDYAEVVTRDGKSHLVRMSLAEFEARLPTSRFLRVHRSTIVNLALLGRAEPIGSGRLALHMAGGQTVETSRVGAQTLRSKVL